MTHTNGHNWCCTHVQPDVCPVFVDDLDLGLTLALEAAVFHVDVMVHVGGDDELVLRRVDAAEGGWGDESQLEPLLSPVQQLGVHAAREHTLLQGSIALSVILYLTGLNYYGLLKLILTL